MSYTPTYMKENSNIFILHGAFGDPNENWLPWLKTELEKLGCQVYIPLFPTPENQSLETWRLIFNSYQKKLTERSILVGHSIATAFILDILEKLDHPIKAVFLISSFIQPLNNQNFDQINQTFYRDNFDWKQIKKNCQHFYIIHSNNDPYVPLDHAQYIANNLQENITIIKNGGHFNTASGYEKFPELLTKVITEINI